MGDHRASVVIKFSMHGVEKEMDSWINYYPSDDVHPYKVDRRVLEWLTAAYDEAMDKYFDAQYDAEQIDRAKVENEERDELARLKAKYETD